VINQLLLVGEDVDLLLGQDCCPDAFSCFGSLRIPAVSVVPFPAPVRHPVKEACQVPAFLGKFVGHHYGSRTHDGLFQDIVAGQVFQLGGQGLGAHGPEIMQKLVEPQGGVLQVNIPEDQQRVFVAQDMDRFFVRTPDLRYRFGALGRCHNVS